MGHGSALRVMRRFFLALLIAVAWISAAPAQSAPSPGDLVGSWLYRSFHNRPEPVAGDPAAALKLIFGEGDFEIVSIGANKVTGMLSFGTAFVLDIEGTYKVSPDRTSVDLRLTGKGRAGTKTDGWIYDYIGFSVPTWPNAVDQRGAIVGSVIRTVQHGTAPAGVTASFVMIRK